MLNDRPLHICDEHAEGACVPTAAFMLNMPTWRLDVPGDILLHIQPRQHAAVELHRELALQSLEAALERQLQAFRQTCKRLGPVMPENVKAPIVPDLQLTGPHT